MTYQGLVHYRLGGAVFGAFKKNSNWYGSLTITEDGTCTANNEDGSVFASAPASHLSYGLIHLRNGAGRPLLSVSFPDAKKLTLDFARGLLKQQSSGQKVFQIASYQAILSGQQEKDRFIAVLKSWQS